MLTANASEFVNVDTFLPESTTQLRL